MKGERCEQWQPAPDTEDIGLHLIEFDHLPDRHADEGCRFFALPAHHKARIKNLNFIGGSEFAMQEQKLQAQIDKGITL